MGRAVSRPAGDAGVELWAALPTAQRDPEFASTERQAGYAARLGAAGIRTALWAYEAEAEPAVAALQARLGLRVNPVVPNMKAYLRDASDYGVVGAALQRFRRLRVADQARIALHQVARAAKVVARDFATGVLVIVEMELSKFRRAAPSCVLLNASVTDLVLALDNARLAREFVHLAEKTYGLPAGLATYNYGVLGARLEAWGVRPSVVAAPFNPRGYLMNPSRAACERTLAGSGVDVVATHVEVDGLVGRKEAVDYLTGLGIRTAVVALDV